MSSPEMQYFTLRNFAFQDGTIVEHAQLAYRQTNVNASKVAVVQTCFRGRLQSTLTLAQGALRDYRVVVIALFGNGESSSPSNTTNYPKSIAYQDCVAAQHELLTKHLGIQHVDVMMGFSMGGQCTYHWLALHPKFVRNAVIICSAARTSRHNYQFLEGPKAAMESSVDYGSAAHRSGTSKPYRGLHAFGKAYSAWLTSAEWFEQELYKTQGYESLADWDKNVAGLNYHDWDSDDLLAKLNMWQRGDIRLCYPGGADLTLQEALARIDARVLLLPCQTDQYFHWEASEREAQALKDGVMKVIPSVWGHIAGGGSNSEDTEWIDQSVSEFLKSAT